jgi:hypothetical protein
VIKAETPQIRYATEALPGGDRFIRTVGLAGLGQTEIGALVEAKRDPQWDVRVMGVLQFVVNYVVDTGARILPEETVEYGWTHLRLRRRTPTILEAYEIEDVYSNEPEPSVVPGVDRALHLIDAADDVMRRNGFGGVGDFPYRGRGAITCIHLTADATQSFFMERDLLHDVRDSGWTIDCGEMREEHGESDLFIEHLADLAMHRPFIVPYLTLPIGSGVSFEPDGAFIFPPGKEESRRDPGKPYAFGPWSLSE